MLSSADAEYLVRQWGYNGYLFSSLVAPPAYTAFLIARRGRQAFSLQKVLRATWLSSFAGAGAAGGLGLLRYSYANEDALRVRRIRSAYDTSRIRREDHAVIGTVLFAVATPAILWNRARIIDLILGGAGIGSGVGVIAHYAKILVGDKPNQPPLPPIAVEAPAPKDETQPS